MFHCLTVMLIDGGFCTKVMSRTLIFTFRKMRENGHVKNEWKGRASCSVTTLLALLWSGQYPPSGYIPGQHVWEPFAVLTDLAKGSEVCRVSESRKRMWKTQSTFRLSVDRSKPFSLTLRRHLINCCCRPYRALLKCAHQDYGRAWQGISCSSL